MTNKITKREVINAMLAEETISANATYRGYLEHELELLDRKAANKKPTKNQQENEGIKEEILANLTEEGVTVTELMKRSAVLGEQSNQKLSALLKQLKDEGKVTKSTEGKKSVFALKA